jgi:hypothetical protein
MISIAEIKTVSPLGMVKSPLMQINETTWQINVTWTPTAINDTSNVFCFTATDTTGYVLMTTSPCYLTTTLMHDIKEILNLRFQL